MATLKVSNLSKNFGSTQVLRQINLEVSDGEFLVLLGPSGCGKSTLLNIIAGLETLDDGEISIDDYVVNKMEPKDRNIAMVFQSYALYPAMTVRDNITFGLKQRKVSKEQTEKSLNHFSKMLKVDQLLERKPAQLSGGQRQRVAMGRALVRDPKIFLFDEPLSNLDAKLRVDMRAEIKKLHHRLGTTIIYVTHDQIEAMTLGNRIAVMKEGDIVQLGTPREVYSEPVNRYVAEFIGSPSMNFIPVTVEARSGKNVLTLTPKGQSSVEVPAPNFLNGHEGREVTLGLRPEQITNLPQWKDAIDVHSIKIEVEVTEPTGPDTLVFTEINGASVISRCHPENMPEDGAVMSLSLSMSNGVFFNPDNGERFQ
jgi:multiple sugar transport system ATP-binding protein